MKNVIFLVLGIGILIFGGVWVWKARTPSSFPPAETINADPSASADLNAGAPTAMISPESNAGIAPAPVQKIMEGLKPVDQQKFLILEEILASKNDNDPRMDSDLKELTPELKRAMSRYYQALAPEKRNDRGTIVFLIARAMESSADVTFMKDVLMEQPCLSLGDCQKVETDGGPEAKHLEGLNETTAHYPQLMAIQQSLSRYQQALGESPPNRVLAEQIVSMLREAMRSPNPRVVQEAEYALKSMGR